MEGGHIRGQPVALATSPISTRSGTVCWGIAVSASARAWSTRLTSRAPNSQRASTAAPSATLPRLVTRFVAGSYTKSYSLVLPAQRISSPRTRAHTTSCISRLGWSPSTGV